MRRRASPAFASGADSRPRIHVWPQPAGGAKWSIGLQEHRGWAPSAGRAVDDALACFDRLPSGAVIILEPLHG